MWLLIAELFGYERGAFTGAEKKKMGRFELADKGTIFLDEIGNIPLTTQAKLLRVIQEKKVQHLGGKKDIPVDVRIIAATNIVLEDAVKEGKFREDLYHRINEFKIVLPPLRERAEDIPHLSKFFLEESNNEFNKQIKNFESAAMEMLKTCIWRGNIRELRNTVKRAVLISDGQTVQARDLAKTVPNKKESEATSGMNHSRAGSGQVGVPENFENFDLNRESEKIVSTYEKAVIVKALENASYNRTKAAELLGISREDLYYKIKKLKIKIS